MKQILKNGVLLAIAGIFLISCNNNTKQSAEEILQDSQKQEAIMTTISNDHQMMTNMIGHMMKNDHAMQMMTSNQDMMGKMMKGNSEMMGNMMKMMQKDTTMCRMMGKMMMKDDNTKEMMMDIMKEDGMDAKSMKGKNKEDHSSHN